MTMPPPEDFLPFPEASQATGIPKRTLYRWKEEGRLKAKTIDGKTTVSVIAIRALSATRDGADTAISGARAGTSAGNGTTAAPMAPVGPYEGDQAASLFAAFERGESPVEIVQRLRLSPPVVLAAHRQYVELCATAAPTAAQARNVQLEATVSMLVADINGLQGAIVRMDRDLAALAGRVSGLPIPERGSFTCDCGHTGWVSIATKCTACGRTSERGFYPPKQ